MKGGFYLNNDQSNYVHPTQSYYYPQSSPAYYPAYNRQTPQTQQQDVPGMLPMQQSYIENILRLNRGKKVNVYMTFENNSEWNAKVFSGTIEAAGRDHIIIRDPKTEKRYLLLMVYLDYITFDEEINYEYPFSGAAGPGQFSNYPPR